MAKGSKIELPRSGFVHSQCICNRLIGGFLDSWRTVNAAKKLELIPEYPLNQELISATH
jgi:hypothetical protein